jgi:hypothetical protein
MLIDQLSDEPGQMISGQPLIQRGREQQLLIRVEGPKRLIHRPTHQPNRLYPLDLEQTVTFNVTKHNPSSRGTSNDQPNLPGVLLTHAPR